jgi:biopolymer transport protein TolQ
MIQLEPTVFFPIADATYALSESSVPGKVIVLLLFIGSIIAWSIMVSKYIELRRAARSSERFLKLYEAESHPVALYLKRTVPMSSPLSRVYEAGCGAIGRELELLEESPYELKLQGLADSSVDLSASQIQTISDLGDRVVNGEILRLERHMMMLATAVSAAPFLGLLGTVWGVMDGFGAMAKEGAATLSAVAPGISAALLTTVVGLLVALPSSVGYNLLIERIRGLTVLIDNFSQEFNSSVRRTYERIS